MTTPEEQSEIFFDLAERVIVVRGGAIHTLMSAIIFEERRTGLYLKPRDIRGVEDEDRLFTFGAAQTALSGLRFLAAIAYNYPEGFDRIGMLAGYLEDASSALIRAAMTEYEPCAKDEVLLLSNPAALAAAYAL
ncbi:MAG TPA: hypothetical protein VLE99_04565 [Candidatus Saccharimonadales bacterium]|nr:hypothetical protein [Candidatus Saccharimonadales bacterium]